MKLFENIREFFWPLLEKGKAQKIQKLEPNEIKVENKHLEQTLKYALDFYESEAQRKKTVEGKTLANDTEIVEWLLDTAEVAAVPGCAFGLEPYFRVSYATSLDLLTEAMDRIEKAVLTLS